MSNLAVPRPVRAAVVVWLVAVGAGVAETLVHLALPDPPGPAALLKRAVVSAGVVILVLALPEGRNIVRWTLAVLFGLLGIAVLVVEPITWLAAGELPAGQLAVAVLRALHLAALVVALVLMFRPAANAFFRSARRVTPASGAGVAS